MTENEQKQQFSIAYVSAIVARAGYKCQVDLVDDDSVDLRIGATGKIRDTSFFHSPSVEIQLKATSQTRILQDTHIAFPLPKKNYEDLRKRSALPRYLVVLLVPSDIALWIEQDEERMISRGCAYYISLKGMEASENKRNLTIRLPRTNQFTVECLESIMYQASLRRGK
jgi:Domain of unknown function (DUF4365)